MAIPTNSQEKGTVKTNSGVSDIIINKDNVMGLGFGFTPDSKDAFINFSYTYSERSFTPKI
jgi:hypothetical protein